MIFLNIEKDFARPEDIHKNSLTKSDIKVIFILNREYFLRKEVIKMQNVPSDSPKPPTPEPPKPPQVPPAEPVKPPTPQTAPCTPPEPKALFYIISFFVGLFGIIFGIVYLTKPEPECKRFGKNCLLLGIIPPLVLIVMWAIIMALVLGRALTQPATALFLS